jgi:hypothetical protein
MAYLYLLMVVWVVLQVFWPANPSRLSIRTKIRKTYDKKKQPYNQITHVQRIRCIKIVLQKQK